MTQHIGVTSSSKASLKREPADNGMDPLKHSPSCMTPQASISPARITMLSSLYSSSYCTTTLESSIRFELTRNFIKKTTNIDVGKSSVIVTDFGFYALWTNRCVLWCAMNSAYDSSKPVSDRNAVASFDMLGVVDTRDQFALSDDGRVLCIISQQPRTSDQQILDIFVDGKPQTAVTIPAGKASIHQITSSFKHHLFSQDSKTRDEDVLLNLEQFANSVGYICLSIRTEAVHAISKHLVIRYGSVTDCNQPPFLDDATVLAFAINPTNLDYWVVRLSPKSVLANPWTYTRCVPVENVNHACRIQRINCNGALLGFMKLEFPPPFLLAVTRNGDFVIASKSASKTDGSVGSSDFPSVVNSPTNKATSPKSKMEIDVCNYGVVAFDKECKLIDSIVISNKPDMVNTGIQLYVAKDTVYIMGRTTSKERGKLTQQPRYDVMSSCLLGVKLDRTCQIDPSQRTFCFSESDENAWFIPAFTRERVEFTQISKSWDMPWTTVPVVSTDPGSLLATEDVQRGVSFVQAPEEEKPAGVSVTPLIDEKSDDDTTLLLAQVNQHLAQTTSEINDTTDGTVNDASEHSDDDENDNQVKQEQESEVDVSLVNQPPRQTMEEATKVSN